MADSDIITEIEDGEIQDGELLQPLSKDMIMKMEDPPESKSNLSEETKIVKTEDDNEDNKPLKKKSKNKKKKVKVEGNHEEATEETVGADNQGSSTKKKKGSKKKRKKQEIDDGEKEDSAPIETKVAKKKRSSDEKEKDESASDKKKAPTEEFILSKLWERHRLGLKEVNFPKFSQECGFHERTKTWVSAWKACKDKGLIAKASSGKSGCFELTEDGIDAIASEEDKEMMKGPPSTSNEDLHKFIKKQLVTKKTKNRGAEIFDFLIEHGSLTRQELADMVGIHSGSHSFSYALKMLKDLGYVERDPNSSNKQKLRLSSAAFVGETTET